jgi:hypothetical protein
MHLSNAHVIVMTESMMPVEVAYGRRDDQRIVSLTVPSNTTARDALISSGLVKAFPEIDPATCTLGVFGHVVTADHVLQSGDRVEVYRPLAMDPREARRQLAAQGLTMTGRGVVK